ncbi:uncharacterized protein LOC111988211 [Quercus suber]
MASSKFVAFLAVLVVLLPMSALGANNTTDPFLARVCEEVECGKGTCVADLSYPLGFQCQCDQGWRRNDDGYADLAFLPCVIPNCTLNYSGCQPAPPPVPQKTNPYNLSAFDPCYWAYCGLGTCTRNQTYRQLCTCQSGSSNLLNISVFPCYSECTLGSDCASLGIKVSNSSSSGGSGTSRANSFLPGNFHWMTLLMVSVGLVFWK